MCFILSRKQKTAKPWRPLGRFDQSADKCNPRSNQEAKESRSQHGLIGPALSANGAAAIHPGSGVRPTLHYLQEPRPLAFPEKVPVLTKSATE